MRPRLLALAYGVLHFHADQRAVGEGQAGGLEAGLAFVLGREGEPLHTTLPGRFGDLELPVQLAGVDQRRQRAVLFFNALFAYGRLLQVGVVDPHLLAVGDDQPGLREQPVCSGLVAHPLAGRRFAVLGG